MLELLGRRSTTKQIAARLLISEVIVRRHVGALLKKLGVGDRNAAIKLVDSWPASRASEQSQDSTAYLPVSAW